MNTSSSTSPALGDFAFSVRSSFIAACLASTALMTGCAGEEEEAGPPPPADALVCAAQAASAAVTLCGTATFVSVPNNTTTGALNYAAAKAKPIRGATAELLNVDGATLATAVTDDSGAYAFSVRASGDMRVRIRAEMKKVSGSGGQWDFTVRDNTSGDALYVLDSAPVVTVQGGVVQRNVLAESGFDGTRYSGVRSAGPFAILDVAFEATKKILSVSPQQVFPPLQLFWSVKNAPAEGNVAVGQIGGSFYAFDQLDGQHKLFLLGQENVDTDEYDSHVVAHEWGHYFQSAFSRDDSIGGPHTFGDKLDMRVAFSEGWGNAWSAMALGSPIYADSGMAGQSGGFIINVAQAPAANDQSWFSESSVQFLMFNFHQASTVGFEPIFKVMTGSLAKSSAFTAIHNFATLLKDAAPGGTATINSLLQGQKISTLNDPFGAGETNNGGVESALPIYRAITAGPHCVTAKAGLLNKLGNAAYLKFTTTAGAHTLTLTSVANQTGTDPDFVVTTSEGTQEIADSFDEDNETATLTLPAGTHTLVLQDFNLAATQSRCFNFTVQ